MSAFCLHICSTGLLSNIILSLMSQFINVNFAICIVHNLYVSDTISPISFYFFLFILNILYWRRLWSRNVYFYFYLQIVYVNKLFDLIEQPFNACLLASLLLIALNICPSLRLIDILIAVSIKYILSWRNRIKYSRISGEIINMARCVRCKRMTACLRRLLPLISLDAILTRLPFFLECCTLTKWMRRMQLPLRKKCSVAKILGVVYLFICASINHLSKITFLKKKVKKKAPSTRSFQNQNRTIILPFKKAIVYIFSTKKKWY